MALQVGYGELLFEWEFKGLQLPIFIPQRLILKINR